MSEQEILDEMGAPEPSKRRKWCLVLSVVRDDGKLRLSWEHPAMMWKATAWFATRRAATDYGIKHHRREGFAVGRMEWLAGFKV